MKFKFTTRHLLYIALLQILIIDIFVIGFFLNKVSFFQKRELAPSPISMIGQAPFIQSQKENSALNKDPALDVFLKLNRFSRQKSNVFVFEHYLSTKKSFVATAYDLSYKSCGKYPSHPEYGITFSGIKAKKGRTVAVDPAIVPIGSYIQMEFPKEYYYLNGWYIAEDTGSKVKGNIIDVFFGEPALGEMEKFGRRKVEVRIIYPQDVKKLLQSGVSYITINGNK